MARPDLVPLDRPEVAPRPISPRLRAQLVYFMSAPATPGVPALGEHEYWFAADEVGPLGRRGGLLPRLAARHGQHDRGRADRGAGVAAPVAQGPAGPARPARGMMAGASRPMIASRWSSCRRRSWSTAVAVGRRRLAAAARRSRRTTAIPRTARRNDRLVEALALGIDNIEIDLGWDEAGQPPDRRARRRRPGRGWPIRSSRRTLVPALEAHWRSAAAGRGPDGPDDRLEDRAPRGGPAVQGVPRRPSRLVLLGPQGRREPAHPRRLTVCFSGSDEAKDLYDALDPAGRRPIAPSATRVFGAGPAIEPTSRDYVPGAGDGLPPVPRLPLGPRRARRPAAGRRLDRGRGRLGSRRWSTLAHRRGLPRPLLLPERPPRAGRRPLPLPRRRGRPPPLARRRQSRRRLGRDRRI